MVRLESVSPVLGDNWKAEGQALSASAAAIEYCSSHSGERPGFGWIIANRSPYFRTVPPNGFPDPANPPRGLLPDACGSVPPGCVYDLCICPERKVIRRASQDVATPIVDPAIRGLSLLPNAPRVRPLLLHDLLIALRLLCAHFAASFSGVAVAIWNPRLIELALKYPRAIVSLPFGERK